jgi:acyl-CoA-dependent ceramide synthase
MGRPRKPSQLGEDIPGDTAAAMSTMHEISPVDGEAPKWDKVYPYP